MATDMAGGTLAATMLGLNGTDVEELCKNMSSLCGNETLLNNGTNATGNNTEGLATGSLELPHPVWLTIVLGIAAAIVIIVTVLGNILVLLSFVLERSIRQPTNYFIASLAMSDLLIGTFSMPCFTLYLLLGYWPLGEIICDIWLSLDWTICLASQYTVFFITTDRFCSVKYPAKYRNWRTDKKVRIMIALSWTIPSLVFFTTIIGWQYFVGERTVEPKTCEVQFLSDPLFPFLLTIVYFWTTLIVMITLYVGIYRVALALQRKSNEKHKKMNHAMELAKNKTTKASSGGAKAKESKKRVENNNARYLRGVQENNTLTTSFSRHSDNEYSKPSEEDRSSSPAFASDEDEGSSAEMKKEGCYVNSAVQTEPTLKGMLGSSVNHMSRLAFSLSGTSVSASQASSSGDKDSSDEHQHQHEVDHIKPLLQESNQVMFKPVKESPKPNFDGVLFKEENQIIDKHNESATPLIESDVLDGIRYIDEDSLKSLTSTDNVKLLAEIKELSPRKTEAESPVWRKRVVDDDKSLLVPNSGESGSSEAMSSSVIETTAPNHANHNKKCNDVNNKKADSHKVLTKSRKDENKRLKSNVRNHNDKKSKDKHTIGSPLQSLVRSLRPSANKKAKPVKSKSENRARKALRTISIILGAYVLCWTPYHVMVFIIGICGNWSCINLHVYYFTYWLCYLNSPINPFCYAFANAQFKRTFIRILKFDFHRT
ncbi:muscarinic acetylcholine receptor M2-like [Ruditapes philippinarum]|uniref:muscarinic acetylcholine receptor M2-like n=1 Tax=Ruditapes philippinarum TaxID=129788 RepID=UPI00295A5AE1|nr:muscarinic acetylcholine receptor M2-like [Ruditapes philippinarum]XP_060557462.1 muscarinic acetylcholine receptor M2-like [Ruditapes philippinarum]XP_060557538.1 muscarinic acetylcholine receptor M2-like [Ruditapes philippinarum]XP_060557606.1 muscarinic acetylcholine receptor M2-like [Ruditapes philippinarum]